MDEQDVELQTLEASYHCSQTVLNEESPIHNSYHVAAASACKEAPRTSVNTGFHLDMGCESVDDPDGETSVALPGSAEGTQEIIVIYEPMHSKSTQN